MIYLSPTVYLFPGVDTWWEWFERSFDNTSHNLPARYNNNDVVLRYSTEGAINAKPGKSIALCWELLPELKRVFNSNEWDSRIGVIFAAAKSCDRILITTEFARADYEPYGRVDNLPIGVDTDFFRPYSDDEKYAVKMKYGIPLNREVGFWCGSPHPMKGSENLRVYARENPDIYWILVWYSGTRGFPINAQHHQSVSQATLVELMNCADFQLGTSLLRPYYIVEYEGMSCNLKQRKITNLPKDFEVGDNPRNVIFEKKWDRHTCKQLYKHYIDELINGK